MFGVTTIASREMKAAQAASQQRASAAIGIE
jgi:hypothetical protein